MSPMEQERRHSFLTPIMAGMEACWLYTALLVMTAKTGSGELSPALILSLYPISWALDRILQRLPWTWIGKSCARLAVWLLCTLAFGKGFFSSSSNLLDVSWIERFAWSLIRLASFPNQEQLFLLSGALVWWLGRRLARLRPRFSVLISEFQFGFSMLLMLFFVAAMWGMNLPGLVPVCLVFFAFSFLGISLAHAREGKGWLHGGSRNQWLSILLFALCLAFGLGLFLSAIITPELLKILLNLLKLLWHCISELMSRIIAFLASLFPKSGPVPMPAPMAPPAAPAEPPAWVELFKLPEWFRRVGQLVVSSLWLILVLAALWSVSSQIIHWLRHKLDHDEGAAYEPMSGAFREDLMHLLRIFLNRLSRMFRLFRKKRVGHDAASREVQSVRQIYRHLLGWAASAGCPRHAAQTPGEYLLTLTRWFPEGRLEFSLITEQYVFARYSPFSPAKESLENMVKTWDRLKRMRVQKRDVLVGQKPEIQSAKFETRTDEREREHTNSQRRP